MKEERKMSNEKKNPKTEEAAGAAAAAVVMPKQVQHVLSMLDDGARFKNVAPEKLKTLLSHSVKDLFNKPELRQHLFDIPNKITVIKADESETQVPVFTNKELMLAGIVVVDKSGEPIPHFKDKKEKRYIPLEEVEIPLKDADAETIKVFKERYGSHSTAVLILPLIDRKNQNGDTVLLSCNEAWQQWNKTSLGAKKKKSSSKSGTARDPIAYCDKMIAETQDADEKVKWEARKITLQRMAA
jgi:hypothetical protein